MKYAIVQLLKDAAPGYVSGGELGRRFDVSRTAVWKYIEELRQEGYSIEASSRKGYRLLSSEDRLNAYEIACGLNTSIVGREVLYFDSLDSTNNYAREIAAEGCSDGMSVIAGQQTAGRGRLGRGWESPPDKGIYISVVLRPPLAPVETQILTLAAAVAAANAISEATGLDAGIKWPNDLIIDGRKVCGILLEMNSEADRVNYVILGIGINYSQNEDDFPEELRDRAISLKTAAEKLKTAGEKGEAVGGPGGSALGQADASGMGSAGNAAGMGFSRLSIVRSVLCQLDSMTQLVLTDDNAKVLQMWRNKSVTLGREVSFRLKDTGYTGTAVDITDDGRLLVSCNDGVCRELLSGEVSVRGIYGYVR